MYETKEECDKGKSVNIEVDKENTKEKGNRSRKIKSKIIFEMIAILAILYVGMSIYFMNHFNIGTFINDENYGGRSPRYVDNEIMEMIDNYQLKIIGRNNIENIIKGNEIKLKYHPDDTLTEIMKSQNGWLWFTGFFQKQNYELSRTTEYDDSVLEAKIKDLSVLQASKMEKPKNAYISEYSNENGYEIIAEKSGSTLNVDKTKKTIREMIDSVESELNLEDAGCYMNPEITKETKSLIKDCNLLNKYVNATVTYDFEIANETIEKEQIKDWITYNSTGIHFDEEKVRECVNSIARKYDTYGRNRKFTTISGNTLELLSGGYGWRVDRAAETEQLIADIKSGEDITREMIYVSKGYVRKDNGEGGVDDIGDTYVEINLGEQHLYVVKESKIVEESDFVSGKLSNGNGTPAGVFGITYKEKNATLSGESYESHVNYWMPFNGNIGMHDATWRKEFGKDIYITNGSHGCVNLPLEKAEIIYDLVEKGMPVVCYY